MAEEAKFTEKIKSYVGDDPLSEWLLYIDWLESAYSGGTEQDQEQIYAVLSRCCQLFYQEGRESKKYFDDDRFVKLWIKLASCGVSAVQVYQYMHKHEIGSKSVDVYLNWVGALDANRELEEAQNIIQHGLVACAALPVALAKLHALQNRLSGIMAEPSVTKKSQSVFRELLQDRPEATNEEENVTRRLPDPVKQIGRKIPSVSGDPLRKPILSSNLTSRDGSKVPSNSTDSSPSDSNQSIKAGLDQQNRFKKFTNGGKKPRDSLCIKRYDKLHAPRVLTHAEMQQVRVTLNNEEDQPLEMMSKTPLGQQEQQPLDSAEKQPQDNDSGWGSQGYRDVSPGLPMPPTIDRLSDARAEPALPTESNTKFMWNAVQFPSGVNEISFEENLAARWRQRQKFPMKSGGVVSSVKNGDFADSNSTKAQVKFTSEITTEIPLAERTLSIFSGFSAKIKSENGERKDDDRVRIAEERLQIEQERCALSEQRLIHMQEQLEALEEERQNAEAKNWALEEKIHSMEIERRTLLDHAEENRRLADLQYHTGWDILQSITSSLVIFCRDLSTFDDDYMGAVVQFAETVRSKIDRIISARSGNEPQRHLEVLRSVTADVVRTVEDCRLRMLSKPLAKPRDILQVRSDETTFGCGDLVDEDNGMRSGTRSSLLPFSQQSDRTNPMIKAMWNQTNQTMNCTSRDQLSARDQPPSVHFVPPTGRRSLLEEHAQPGPTESDTSKFGPIRQSLAARKSVKVLQTSALEDMENQPVFHQTRPTLGNFNIFVDQSYGPEYLPSVPPTNVDMDKESDDDSENTPPLDSIQADLASKSQTRHVIGILNESIDHPGVPMERLTEKDFIEVVESDSDYDSDSNRKPVVRPVEEAAAACNRTGQSYGVFGPAAAPQPLPRKSLASLGDLQDEFNTSFDCNGRKSIGGTDQTLPFLSNEVDFFRSIDPKKHMASTPVVLSMAEEQTVKERLRNKPRASYLPPAGASKLLSPITEGSRENKSATPSSSGVSTWTKSKKSLGNYSPLKENDEVVSVDPYSPALQQSFKDRLEDRIKDSSTVSLLTETPPTDIVVGRTQIRLKNLRFTVEELLHKSKENGGSVIYSIRCRTDANLAWAMKIRENDGWWNYYIQSEATRRIQTLPGAERDVFGPYILPAVEYHAFKDNSSHVFMPLCEQGTLMKLVMTYQRSADKTVPEVLALKYAVDIFRAVEGLHSVNLIHGDIRADNFLLQNMSKFGEVKTPAAFVALPSLILTDFQSGIDVTLFEGPVIFTGLRKGRATSGSEILSAAPWTYQIDYLGILDVLHLLLFGEPMKLTREDDMWRPVRVFRPTWMDIWYGIFIKLLNVPGCDCIPDIAAIRRDLEEAALLKLESTDLTRLVRQVRVTFFMGRRGAR